MKKIRLWSRLKMVFTFSKTDALQSRLVAQAILSTLHDKSETGVNGLDGLLLLLINKNMWIRKWRIIDGWIGLQHSFWSWQQQKKQQCSWPFRIYKTYSTRVDKFFQWPQGVDLIPWSSIPIIVINNHSNIYYQSIKCRTKSTTHSPENLPTLLL